MNITIDTNNITERDKKIIKLLFGANDVQQVKSNTAMVGATLPVVVKHQRRARTPKVRQKIAGCFDMPNAMFTAEELAKRVNLPLSSIYYYLNDLKMRKEIEESGGPRPHKFFRRMRTYQEG